MTDAHDNAEPADCTQIAHSFLDHVLPDEGVIVIAERKQPGKQFINHFVQTTAEAATLAVAIDQRGNDAYFACATYAIKGNRLAENAKLMKSFWVDLDCGEDKAAKGAGYKTRLDAGRAVNTFSSHYGLPTPTIANSGGGLHCYWVLDAAIDADVWLLVAERLKLLAANGEVKLLADKTRTAERASVLRVPGTHNRKPERAGAKVTLIYQSEPISYSEFKTKISAACAVLGVMNYSSSARGSAKATRQSDFAANMDSLTAPETPAEVARVKSMLKVIPAGCDRETWLKVIWAIASTGWVCAEQLAREWSMTP